MHNQGLKSEQRPRYDSSSRKFSNALAIIFAMAMVMGAGPGIYLVNPDVASTQVVTSIYSIPILYLWAVFWFFVQATVVLICYFSVWNESDK